MGVTICSEGGRRVLPTVQHSMPPPAAHAPPYLVVTGHRGMFPYRTRKWERSIHKYCGDTPWHSENHSLFAMASINQKDFDELTSLVKLLSSQIQKQDGRIKEMEEKEAKHEEQIREQGGKIKEMEAKHKEQIRGMEARLIKVCVPVGQCALQHVSSK